jgi:DNA-binding GntR family transcriptional regulator
MSDPNPSATAAPPRSGHAQAAGGRAEARLVREAALDNLRHAIVSGRLAPGTRMTERELCQRYSVSRTVAREIVRRLEAERLVDVTPHRGLRIAVLTPREVEEIFAIRAEIEVMLVRSFVAAASDEDIAVIEAVHDRMFEAAGRRDFDAIIAAWGDYLGHMIRATGVRVVGEVLNHLLARINMLRFYAMRTEGQLETSVLQLRAILQSIRARDADGAEAGVRVYVRTAGQAALAQLEAGGNGG